MELKDRDERFVFGKRDQIFDWESKAKGSYSSYFAKVDSKGALIARSLKLAKDTLLSIGVRSKLSLESGKTMCASADTIHLGTKIFDSDKPLDELLDIFTGLVAHEGAHQKYSSYDPRMFVGKSSLVRSLTNLIEDERVEFNLCSDYPGISNFIAQTKKHYFGNPVVVPKEIKDTPKGVLTRLFNLLTSMVRFPSSVTDEDKKEFEDFYSSVSPLIESIPRDTAECVSIATNLEEEIKKEFKRRFSDSPKEKSDSSEGPSDEDNSESDDDKSESKEKSTEKQNTSGEDASEDNSEDKSTDERGEEQRDSESSEKEEQKDPNEESECNEESDSEKSTSTEEQTETEEDNDEKSNSEKSEEGEPIKESKPLTERDMIELLSEMTEMLNKGDSEKQEESRDSVNIQDLLRENGGEVPDLSSDGNTIFTKKKGDRTRYQAYLKEVRQWIPSMSKAVKGHNTAVALTMRNMRSGQLDTDKLADAYQGVDTVYMRNHTKKSSKATIVVVVDESGSMWLNGRIKSATKAAIMLNEAYGNNPNIDLYIYGHTADIAWKNATEISVYREKDFTPPFALGEMTEKCENRDGVAIKEIATRVRKHTKEDAYMIVISDGAPQAENYTGYSALNHLKKSVKEVEKMNFKCIGISIEEHHDMGEVFRQNLKLTDLASFPKQFNRLIKSILLNTRTIIE